MILSLVVVALVMSIFVCSASNSIFFNLLVCHVIILLGLSSRLVSWDYSDFSSNSVNIIGDSILYVSDFDLSDLNIQVLTT